MQKIIRILSNHPEESIPKASQNSAVSQSIYRFWSNKKISPKQIPKQISESHRPSVLNRVRRKFAPKNRSSKPPSLRQAILWIAQLGGFLARSGDGQPGLKTFWRGMGVLHHLLEGSQLAPKT